MSVFFRKLLFCFFKERGPCQALNNILITYYLFQIIIKVINTTMYTIIISILSIRFLFYHLYLFNQLHLSLIISKISLTYLHFHYLSHLYINYLITFIIMIKYSLPFIIISMCSLPFCFNVQSAYIILAHVSIFNFFYLVGQWPIQLQCSKSNA